MYILTHINNINFKTKVLSKPIELMLGMMNKTFTNDYKALLFIMNTPQSSFWMKKCIIPLDVIFINNHIITKIYHSCPPCNMPNCVTYPGIGNLVIEMLGGTCKKKNIKKGDIIKFTKI